MGYDKKPPLCQGVAFRGRGRGSGDACADFHARCLADPVPEHPFSHTGNPGTCGGRPTTAAGFSLLYGGQEAMIRLHAGQGAEADLGDRFVACFVAALDGAGIPDDPRLRAALTAYINWATDDVTAYSPEEAQVSTGLAVPHWGRDGPL